MFAATMIGAYMLVSLLAGAPPGQRGRARDAQPAPRWPDGRLNIGSVPGQKGHWIRTRRELVVDAKTTNVLPGDRRIEQIPFQPWAKALFESRRSNSDRDSPHARCKPDAGPRQIGTAYGFEIVEFFFTEGGGQTLQVITSGSVDVAMSNGLLGTIGAYSKKAPIRVISA